MFSQEKIDLIKDTIDIDLLLDSLGLNLVRRSDKEYRGPCPLHGGDNPTSFRVNIETKRFVCFSHHCERSGGRTNNDVVGLVMAVRKVSFFEAVKFLAELTGISVDSDKLGKEYYDYRSRYEKNKYIRTIDRLKEERPHTIPEDWVISAMNHGSDYFADRGFSPDLLYYFEVGSFIDSFGFLRASIPVRDETGAIVDIAGRLVDGQPNSSNAPKYIHLESFSKEFILYNLDKAKNYILTGWDRRAIIVEGYTDCWHLMRHGYANTVACMGSMIVPNQAAKLAKYALSAIILLDGDEAGKTGTDISTDVLKRFMKIYPIYLSDSYLKQALGRENESKLDPKDLSANELEFILGGIV